MKNKKNSIEKRERVLINYNGVEYTVAEFSNKFNIPKPTVYGRLRNGWDPESIINGSNKYKKRTVEFKGKEVTLKELSDITNIPLPRICARYNSGKNIDEIVADKLYTSHYVYDDFGNRYTLREISEKFEIAYRTLLYRVKNNMPFDCIIKKTKYRNNNSKKIKIEMDTENGKKTLSQISKELNIPYYIVYSRYKKGWCYEKIVNTPYKKQNHEHDLKIMYNNKFVSLSEVAKKTGLKYNTLYVRAKRGYSYDEIINGRNNKK